MSPSEGKRLQNLVDRYEKAADSGLTRSRDADPPPADEVAALRDRLESVIGELDHRVALAEAKAEAAEARANEVLRVAEELADRRVPARRTSA